ncbi:MFS transporter [Paenibacillus campi]|uniref:MFS transporter n=1 Tax=Paenibacillus campi TaxID=3106031 RepID=UPI002AFF5E53|nr:MFS transporter [Paenibacillus sp. SGZ-1014]
MSLLMRNRAALLLLMFNIFLVFTGIGLVIPIMPTYMNELHIGGLLAEYGIRVPFYAAAIAGVVAALATLLLLPESLSPERRAALANSTSHSESLVRQLLQSYRKPYFLSLIIVFVASFGLANYETVFSLFVDHKFGFTAQDIAIIITFGSIAGAVVQATIFGWMINRFGGQRLIIICLLASAVFIVLTLLVHTYFLIFTVTFAVFLAMDILRPAIGTQLSQQAGNEQGYVAGLNSAYTSLGNIAGPIVAGALFDWNVNYPYMMAAFILTLCFLLSLRVKPQMPQRREVESDMANSG